MPTVGEIYVFPIIVWTPEAERDIGLYGAVQILGEVGGSWFVGVLEHFSKDVQVPPDTPLLTLRPVAQFPQRSGEILTEGSTLPETWQLQGAGSLDERKRTLAELFQTWRGEGVSMFESQTAYASLGRVSNGHDSASNGLAHEWRCRFELEAMLQEDEARRARAAEAIRQRELARTWEDIAKQKVGRGYPRSFGTKLRAGYKALVASCEPQPSIADLTEALTTFLTFVGSHALAAEYRDELASLATDVATRRGGSEALALELAERILS